MMKSMKILSHGSAEVLSDKLRSFNLHAEGDFLDLCRLPNDDVIRFFASLEETAAFVFHGTNAAEKFETLVPHQSNDASKESGNKKAIYADGTAVVPMAVAILNKSYLQDKLKSFVTGWDIKQGKTVFKFSGNIYALLKEGDTRLFSEGHVYILDRSDFVNADDAGGEWHSEQARKPLLAVRISPNLASEIYIMNPIESKTVYEYSPEEEKRVFDFAHKK